VRRKLLLIGGPSALVLLLLAGGAAYYFYVKSEGADVRGSSTVEFVPEPPPRPRPRVPPKREKLVVVWPTFGYDAERTRFVPGSPLRPPFRRSWTFRGRTLLEFPPAIAYNRLYLATNAGILFAVDAKTGKGVWHYSSRRCVAASPAVANGIVYESFLNRPPCNTKRKDADGRVIAFDAKSGKVRWSRRMAPTESSPLVANGLVYVGDWSGKVYALDARTGKSRWTFTTGNKVKAAVAISGRRLYVGSYDGHVYALYARTGRLIWRASGQVRLGGRGQFYSTPAAAYGRVYVGSTDGKVYSFGATSGQLRWSQSTGGYVYASPAVWRQRILIGSYSRWFYSLDAATGDVVWKFRANGRISGSATVLHGIVYFATLSRRTYALNAATGRLLWTFPDGKYSPVVADGERLYLTGYTRLYGMVPR
jgi:outer membrane protein assembly factor BamB